MAKMTKEPNSVATTTVRNLPLVNALTVKVGQSVPCASPCRSTLVCTHALPGGTSTNMVDRVRERRGALARGAIQEEKGARGGDCSSQSTLYVFLGRAAYGASSFVAVAAARLASPRRRNSRNLLTSRRAKRSRRLQTTYEELQQLAEAAEAPCRSSEIFRTSGSEKSARAKDNERE